MDAQSDLLASRYARALFEYVKPPFEEQTLFKLEALASFLKQYQLRLVGIDRLTLERIVNLYKLEKIKLNLILMLLEKRKALPLFRSVITVFLTLYKEYHTSMVCVLRSSHLLTDEQKNTFISCIERLSGKRIFYSFVHDRSLIAGIRIESETMVWEHSISRKLRLIEQLQ